MGTQRVATYARSSRVRADALNAIQDRAAVLRPASGSDGGALALTGRDGRYWTTETAGLADGAVAVIDTTRDWRSHRVKATFTRLTAAAQRLQGADAWKRNDPTVTKVVRIVDDGWTGSNTAAITTTPTLSSTVFAILLDELSPGADGIWLFARVTDGYLCLLNDSGATLHAELDFEGSGAGSATAAEPTVPGRLAGDAETTDATWTTIITQALAQSSTVAFRGMVSAIRSTGAEGAAFTLEAAFRRPATGDPVIVGSALYPLVARDDAAYDVRIQVAGSDVVVQVHGAASKTLSWRAEIDTTEARIS